MKYFRCVLMFAFCSLRARISNITSTTIPKHMNNINGIILKSSILNRILFYIFFYNEIIDDEVLTLRSVLTHVETEQICYRILFAQGHLI